MTPIVRTNLKVRSLLGDDLPALEQCSLANFPEVAELLAGIDFLQDHGLLVESHSYRAPESPEDPTGVECQINRWHIENLVPSKYQTPRCFAEVGIAFAMGLLQKAEAVGMKASIRAIVSVQEKTDNLPYQCCTVRLHTLRPENPWLADDLEGYLQECLVVIDQ